MVKKDKPKATKILNGRVTEDIYKKYEAQAKKERRKIGQLVTIVLEDATKSFVTTIAFMIVFCISAFSQKKDSLPPPQQYTFTFDITTFRFIDSIFRDVHSTIGYELKKSDADRKQLNLGTIIYYFESIALRQDSIYRKQQEAETKPKK